MTDTSVDVDQADAAFVPTGRPVARFVTVLAVIVVLLTALSWSGLFNPQVDVELMSQRYDGGAHAGVAVLVVRNRGPFRADVRQITSGNRYLEDVRATPGVPLRVGSGEAQRINISFAVDCARFLRDQATGSGGSDPYLAVHVRVRGAAGPGRRVTAGSGPSSVLCNVPITPPLPSLPPPPASG